MNADVRATRDSEPTLPERRAPPSGTPGRRPSAVTTPLSDDSLLAVEIRGLMERGAREAARGRFEALVSAHQRRATRIAFHYLRNAAEADEAVQDAFVKVFLHLSSYREVWPFEIWFTRILVNGCLDRRKAQARRNRWFSASPVTLTEEARASAAVPGGENAEERLLARERHARLTAAVDRLSGRQRTVFTLCHYGDYTPREVSAMTGLKESTVRVHLFRAAHKLRALLGDRP